MQRKTKVWENRNHIPCMHWAKTRKSHTVVQNRFRLSNTAHFCTDCGRIVGILIFIIFLPSPLQRDNFAGGSQLRILHRKSWMSDKGWASSWRYGEDPIASLQKRPKIPESTENEWNEQGSGVRCVLLLGENTKKVPYLC